ncbi:DUF4238 domain-containing protein [Devosia rhizoryzae]|uniref:DUF4238 domain-containing protein n=1 Tax=Devosia rhizoryzae TaxID=2774137 RepID=A0ABX7C4C7_9HYPH|nr:DUF4238 domain-containing protein [Devosia rhizoryzae]QQR39053.1 DUF4238 domain-containing protein [Devosia rhizoryzae]
MTKSGTHKAQHFIPRSYLSAWCDPMTPAHMEPYVWIFQQYGSAGRRRAPSNLFTESDIYTIRNLDGARDLRLEHALAAIENGLPKLIKEYVVGFLQIPQDRVEQLLAFVAAMHGRTPQSREIQRGLWREMLESAEAEGTKAWSAPSTGGQGGDEPRVPQGRGYTDLSALWAAIESPMRYLLPGAMQEALPALRDMKLTIFCTEEPRFITSDSPISWFDPTVSKEHFLTRKRQLTDPGIEVTLPLTPRHVVMLHRRGAAGFPQISYLKADESTVTALNRRTHFNADRWLVSWRDGFDPAWLPAARSPM